MALSSLLKLAILLPKSVKGKNAFQSLRNCTITCDTKGTINFVEIVLLLRTAYVHIDWRTFAFRGLS